MATNRNLYLTPSYFSSISTTPDCSSSSSYPPWAVFLNFYGKDTRQNFIKALYFALVQAGIRTFRDDTSLEMGDDISEGLHIAIRNSQKFVVVLSENYCLNLIEIWKSALYAIAGIKGYHLMKDANKNELDAVQDIVEIVARQASPNVIDIDKCLFGIGSAVESMNKKISTESYDVRAIAICGMSGIGKTTTAKAFYNKYSHKFEISCFIELATHISQGLSPLLSLLNQLLIHLSRRKDYEVGDVESGLRALKQILCFKKALIVVDDLNQSRYSELLAKLANLVSTGSRILITTREAEPFKQLKVGMPVDIYIVKELGEAESLELFCYHAFRKPIPPESFRELSASFVTYAGGHPLALKVLGSSLCGRTNLSFWKDKLEKIRHIPDKVIQNILRLNYHQLGDEKLKKMFLDIVFYFIGKDKDDALHVLKSCNYFPEVGIPILLERCLLKIDKNNKFQMHNLLQLMGKEVCRQKGKHLYLSQKSACEALHYPKEIDTDAVEVLILDLTLSRRTRISAEIFESFPNLRFLEIIGAHEISGSFKNSFHNLRCIRWHGCPWKYLPSSF